MLLRIPRARQRDLQRRAGAAGAGHRPGHVHPAGRGQPGRLRVGVARRHGGGDGQPGPRRLRPAGRRLPRRRPAGAARLRPDQRRHRPAAHPRRPGRADPVRAARPGAADRRSAAPCWRCCWSARPGRTGRTGAPARCGCCPPAASARARWPARRCWSWPCRPRSAPCSGRCWPAGWSPGSGPSQNLDPARTPAGGARRGRRPAGRAGAARPGRRPAQPQRHRAADRRPPVPAGLGCPGRCCCSPAPPGRTGPARHRRGHGRAERGPGEPARGAVPAAVHPRRVGARGPAADPAAAAALGPGDPAAARPGTWPPAGCPRPGSPRSCCWPRPPHRSRSRSTRPG